MAETSNELKYYDELHSQKYRDLNQSFPDHVDQLASVISDDESHRQELIDIIGNRRFLPAGRVNAALGSSRAASPYNCIVSGTIHDDMWSIMERLKEAALTLRLGSGIGYDFSNLRPSGYGISTLKSSASGPVSFMQMFDAMAKTIHIAHRRAAQMGMLNIHHPDILEFVNAKMEDKLSFFNISVAVTDEFMRALYNDDEFELRFPVDSDNVVSKMKASDLWDMIMSCAWASAEPGIIYIDRINATNNLRHCEDIRATNPCAEQPLPPYGACLLGSFNLTQYVRLDRRQIDYPTLAEDVHGIVRAYDNIHDRAKFALHEHLQESKAKRRMGLGLTGIANAIELLGYPYGSTQFLKEFNVAATVLRETAYLASVDLANERGHFPKWDKDRFNWESVEELPGEILSNMHKYGLRNSHLISYAPCGTISQCAGNVSSGVEPVFFHRIRRDVLLNDGKQTVELQDYNVREHNFYGKTQEECNIEEHLAVAEVAQRNCDSAVSKTINVSSATTQSEYQDVYLRGYQLGLKGLTVYRPNEIRPPVIKSGDCENGECSISESEAAQGELSDAA